MTPLAKPKRRPRIGLVIHSVYNVKFFLVPHIRMLAQTYDVFLFVHNDAPDILEEINLPVRVIEVPIKRHVAPFTDMKAIIILFFLFLRHRLDLVHTMTPKAGLLGTIAAFCARVPRRVHTFQGEVWLHYTGLKRRLFWFLDWLVARLTTHITVVSKSEMAFLEQENILRPHQAQVLGAGSICGVDLKKFDPNAPQRAAQRAQMGYQPDDFVFLYLGRLHKDKGLHVLQSAFQILKSQTQKSIKLLVVGPDEDNLGPDLQNALAADVRIFDYTNKPQDFISASDVLILPSFREGFGMVLIEAAAMGVPAIASQIYGISCAVEDGKSGLLFDVGNAQALASTMARVLNDPNLLSQLSKDGKTRSIEHFDQKIILGHFDHFYAKLLQQPA